MNDLLLIQEKDEDNDQCVIGIATDMENANRMIREYYGEFRELSFKSIQDSGIEWVKVIEINIPDPYKVTVWVVSIETNRI